MNSTEKSKFTKDTEKSILRAMVRKRLDGRVPSSTARYMLDLVYGDSCVEDEEAKEKNNRSYGRGDSF